MKEYFFISGLPRSGSTLLSSILNQNPSFYAGISSSMQEIIVSTISVITNSENNYVIDENRRKELLKDIFESYYKITDKPVVFDTSRGWTAKTTLLKYLFPNTKIICCVRDLFWILDSFEKITLKNTLYNSFLTDPESRNTVTTRCDALMDVKKEGQVVKPYYWLEEGLLANPDMILLVEYEDLCKNPKKIMQDIYNFINMPYFEHDFKNVEYKNEAFDSFLNMHGLHTTKKEVQWEERNSILPRSVWDKYAGKEFWRKEVKNYVPKNFVQLKESK